VRDELGIVQPANRWKTGNDKCNNPHAKFAKLAEFREVEGEKPKQVLCEDDNKKGKDKVRFLLRCEG
jgi:hypothetical protein